MFPSQQLLDKSHSTRLGCCGRGFDDIKEHPFFRNINWAHLEAGILTPPFKPNVNKSKCVITWLDNQLVEMQGIVGPSLRVCIHSAVAQA